MLWWSLINAVLAVMFSKSCCVYLFRDTDVEVG